MQDPVNPDRRKQQRHDGEGSNQGRTHLIDGNEPVEELGHSPNTEDRQGRIKRAHLLPYRRHQCGCILLRPDQDGDPSLVILRDRDEVVGGGRFAEGHVLAVSRHADHFDHRATARGCETMANGPAGRLPIAAGDRLVDHGHMLRRSGITLVDRASGQKTCAHGFEVVGAHAAQASGVILPVRAGNVSLRQKQGRRVISVERQREGDAGGIDTGDCAQPAEEGLLEDPAAGGIITLQIEVDREHGDANAIKPRIDGAGELHAAQEQAATNEEHAGKRSLRHHQKIARPEASAAELPGFSFYR